MHLDWASTPEPLFLWPQRLSVPSIKDSGMHFASLLLANHALDASGIALKLQPLPAAQVLSGQPMTGSAELGRLGEVSIGVWEITPGVSTDVEVDEFFVVLSGEAIVSFADGTPCLVLAPGCVGQLKAGSATTWSVSHTLRKVYIA
jgi:uncharacterized cupin superfamily protein